MRRWRRPPADAGTARGAPPVRSGGSGSAAPKAPAAADALADVSERRLARIGFDLHDGALQSVVGLATDLRLFRTQLAAVVDDGHLSLLLGRVDDLESRLAELERELRELAQSLEPKSLLARPFRDVVRAEVEGFGARSGISTTLTLDGGFGELSASQRLALLRIAQEALTNARKHGRASSVAVTIAESPAGVRLEVVDDGRGFEAEAETGGTVSGLGLAGMRQRAELLGGSLSVESGPGGPTSVTAVLPRWRPDDAA